MIYRGKIFIEGDLACFINKKMSISEEDAELEAYHEESFEIPFRRELRRHDLSGQAGYTSRGSKPNRLFAFTDGWQDAVCCLQSKL